MATVCPIPVGVPDPGDHPGRQHLGRCRLAADDPAVVGVEEPDQRDLIRLGPGGDLRDRRIAGGSDPCSRLGILIHV
jgi:hypothetical protein